MNIARGDFEPGHQGRMPCRYRRRPTLERGAAKAWVLVARRMWVMAKRNNSIASALSRAHGALLDNLAKLEAAAARDVAYGEAELLARLEVTSKLVAEHFRFEEQNGYMNTVRNRDPRFDRIIHQLADEHRELTQGLHRLLEKAAASWADSSFRAEVRDWLNHLRRHEQRENDLVQNAFNLDIGPED
jgi:hypothetical protein